MRIKSKQNNKMLRIVHSVGFEPTSTNTFELESNPLDRSGKNAFLVAKAFRHIISFNYCSWQIILASTQTIQET